MLHCPTDFMRRTRVQRENSLGLQGDYSRALTQYRAPLSTGHSVTACLWIDEIPQEPRETQQILCPSKWLDSIPSMLQGVLSRLRIYTHCGDGGLVAKSCPTLATPCTVACQAPLSMEILQARILNWVAISFSSRFSQSWGQTHVFCICRCVLYGWANREACACYTWRK